MARVSVSENFALSIMIPLTLYFMRIQISEHLLIREVTDLSRCNFFPSSTWWMSKRR